MQQILWLSVAGALGTLSRWLLSSWVQRTLQQVLPLATFVVNAVGCLAFGIIWGIVEQRQQLSGNFRMAALTGFMGAFTTFSTFAFDTSELIKTQHYWAAAGNAIGQTVVGIVFIFLGIALGRLI